MKVNKRLLAPTLLLAVTALAVLAPRLAPYPVDAQFRTIIGEDGVDTFAPHLPSPAHPLGTDRWGFDILTLMLHGMPYTVFFPLTVALFRLIAALTVVFATAACGRGKTLSTGRGELGLLATVPQFVIAYFLLILVTVNPVWRESTLLTVQWLVISLVGLPATLPTVREIINGGLRKQYVEAARAIGVGRRRIFFRHLLPNLRSELASLLLFETITVLLVMGQLGIFDLFIGGTRFTPYPALYHSMVHEWAGLLGQYRNELFTMEWWVALWPLLGYAMYIAVLTLSLRILESNDRLGAVSVKPALSRRS